MIDSKTIEIVSQKLIEAYNPVAIYLFGSYAWGEPNENSDLDLIILIKDTDEKPQKRIKPAYVALRGLGIPKDILVYTVEEFEKNSVEPFNLLYKVKNEGVKLYEAA